jgi:hypothetical protein
MTRAEVRTILFGYEGTSRYLQRENADSDDDCFRAPRVVPKVAAELNAMPEVVPPGWVEVLQRGQVIMMPESEYPDVFGDTSRKVARWNHQLREIIRDSDQSALQRKADLYLAALLGFHTVSPVSVLNDDDVAFAAVLLGVVMKHPDTQDTLKKREDVTNEEKLKLRLVGKCKYCSVTVVAVRGTRKCTNLSEKMLCEKCAEVPANPPKLMKWTYMCNACNYTCAYDFKHGVGLAQVNKFLCDDCAKVDLRKKPGGRKVRFGC